MYVYDQIRIGDNIIIIKWVSRQIIIVAMYKGWPQGVGINCKRYPIYELWLY